MKIKSIIVVMFVVVLLSAQVSAASCIDEVESKNTVDFLTEIPDLNTKLDGVACDNKVSFFKNEVILAKISIEDGSEESFTVTTQKGLFSKIENVQADKPSYIISTGECEFDTLLNAESRSGVFAYLYIEKELDIQAMGFFKKIGFFFVKLVLNPIMKKMQTPVEIACATS
jgi:hypothetical protein